MAGLRVWIDQTRFAAGSAVLDELTKQVRNSRAFVLLATPSALGKDYVKHEVDIASEPRAVETLIVLRTGSTCDPRDAFPSLRKLAWMDLANGELDLAAARKLLLSIRPGPGVASNTRHVYVSCGWGEADVPVTRKVCQKLAARGVRLIGDLPDQNRFDPVRIKRIMSGCGGHLLILPARRAPGKSPEQAYKYFLEEWRIGRELDLPARVLCAKRDLLPAPLRDHALEIDPLFDSGEIETTMRELHDEVEPAAPYAFLATDFKRAAPGRNDAAREIIEHVLGMACVLGNAPASEQLREAIVEKIAASNLAIADVACARNAASNRLDPNLNTCIEAGVAMGARRALQITSLDPASFDPAVRDKTTQIPFMFRNHPIRWYRDDAEFLAAVHEIAMRFRRRILNAELGS